MEIFFRNFIPDAKSLLIMKPLFLLILVFFSSLALNAQVEISEMTLQNRLHYKVSISNATIFVDKFSGGISSLQDKDGIDWIQWKRLEEEKYPESAAGDFRGMPNLVHGGDDSGIGHPGFDKAMCFKERVWTPKEVMEAHPSAAKSLYKVDKINGLVQLMWTVPGKEDCISILKNPALYDKDLVHWVKEAIGKLPSAA